MSFSIPRFRILAHIDWRDFVRELLHTGIAWGVLVMVVIWMAVCQEWSDMRWARTQPEFMGQVKPQSRSSRHGHWHGHVRGPDSSTSTPSPVYSIPLNDVVLSHLPYLEQHRGWISDLLVNTSALFCIIGNLLMARGWRARLVFLRRIAWVMAALYLMRSITISVTTMPPPVINCKPVIATDIDSMASIVWGMISGQTKECTDMVFSGHTVILSVSFLFWARYARHWGFVVYSAVHAVLGIASVLLVRYHYTLDVSLALILTFLVHHMYYRALERAIQRRLAADRRDRLCANEKECTDAPAAAAAAAVVMPIVGNGGFAYSRVGSEDNGHSGSSGIIREIFAHRSRSIESLPKTSLDSINKAELTLTANTPEQEPRRTTSDLVPPNVDLEKAQGAGLFPECYYSSLDAFCCAEGACGQHNRLLLINRPLSNCLSVVVAWMDGLHLR
ncbi:hypothetical protein LPJ64_005817 [Coemansia asiatica]|uniref:Sphingomyelin synthase-like domain-containing protein n=1 Tax=Coemansia asiatica TaxID=1052880 RepID=A0A9W7XFD9_9FUNG|nr:hypothetical protein LPJ64_005817 [Coemansia asiatica]